MKNKRILLLALIILLIPLTGCVRVCRNALNKYAVETHKFEVEQVVLAGDGSVAFVGNHVYYNNVFASYPNIKEKRPGFIAGSSENMKNLVKESLVRKHLNEDAKTSTSTDSSDVETISMKWLELSKHSSSHGYSIPKTGKCPTFEFEPWIFIYGKKSQYPPDMALLPDNLQNVTVYQVAGEPVPFALDGKSVSLDFKGAIVDGRPYAKWWGLVAYPFAKVTDMALNLPLMAGKIIAAPYYMIAD